MKSRLLLGCFCVFLVIPATGQVVPPGAQLFGKSAGDWSAEWVKWVYATCTNENPVLDPDGRWAHVGQPAAPVFLVAGIYQFSATVEREFTVSENRFLFFPLVNVWVDNIGNIPPWSIEQLRDFNRGFLAPTERLDAFINGAAVPDLFSNRAESPVFSLDFTNSCNLVSFVLGTPFTGIDDPIVADGYYLMLEPLPLGQHVLQFGGAIGPPNRFTISSTARITVVRVPLPQWLDDLIGVVETAGAADEQKARMLDNLQRARKFFAAGKLHSGINHLRRFQREVRKQAGVDTALASDLIGYAQRTIERASHDLK